MDSRAAGGYWLESTSAEFDLVRYHLTVVTSHLGFIEKLNIWKINNTELSYKYERKSSGMLKTQGWYNAEELPGDNNLEQVCLRGFHYDPVETKGLEFSTGVIDFPDDSYLHLDHCFVFYEIAIGRSFVYDGNLSSAMVPTGFDSLYIPDQPLDRNRDGKFSLQEYQSAASFDNRDSRYELVIVYVFPPLILSIFVSC
jgi:hypothetical protein